MKRPQPQPRLSPLQEAQLDAIYGYHDLMPDQIARLKAVNEAAKEFERTVRLYSKPSADMMAAVRLIREAKMTANRSIALEGVEVTADPRREGGSRDA